MTQATSMTDAEFRCRREYLGVGMEQLAQLLRVAQSTVKAWEYGQIPIPAYITDKLDSLETQTEDYIVQLGKVSKARGYIVSFRDNPEFRAHNPALSGLGAAWHRRCAEIVSRDHALPIRYPDNHPVIAL